MHPEEEVSNLFWMKINSEEWNRQALLLLAIIAVCWILGDFFRGTSFDREFPPPALFDEIPDEGANPDG